MVEKFFEFIKEKIERLKEQNLYRQVVDLESREGMKISIGGREFINFSSNDYLGLSQHPLVKEVSIEAVRTFGVGGGASRLLCGGTILHRKLEELLSEFKGSERALLLNSGYSANTSLIPALTEEEDIILSDELNHASIIDGCRLSKARRLIYRHGNLEHLRELLRENPCRGKRIVITDSVFSMDGDIAPIKELYELCLREGILLYIDDAHGTGVLGEGRGALRHFGLGQEKFVIQMGTLSKAVGAFGAFVSGDSKLIEYFINFSRGFIFSTALPPSVVASAYASVKLITEDKSLVKNLWKNTERVLKFIKENGLRTTNTETPIIPILFDSVEETMMASKILQSLGIYAPAIRPPTVKTPRIRITISAAHREEEIERLFEGLLKIKSISRLSHPF